MDQTGDDAATTFFLEAFAPEHRADPYPLCRRMRERGPVLSTGTGMHLVFDHATAWSVLRNPAASSDERRSTMVQTDPRHADLLETRPLLVFMDPPDHTRLRGLVAQGFTPRRIEQLRADIEETAAALVAELPSQATDGVVDVVEHLAAPLPITVICTLLGVPFSDRDRFGAWSAALTKSIDPEPLRSAEDQAAIEWAMIEVHDYTLALLDDRRLAPGDDLLSDLLRRHGADEDHLHDDELADLVTLLLVAGHETTVNLIGNGLVALLDRPDQLGELGAQPGLVESAVDELLRFDTPLQMVQRIPTEPLAIGDRVVPAGDLVAIMLGAANRDPAVFDAPDRLDVHRPNAGRHLSFGGGIHHCLGAALARTEGAATIAALLRAFPQLRAAGPWTLRDNFNLRGRATVPIRLR